MDSWGILYETEQTWRREDGYEVKCHLATHAGSQRAALICAHVTFVEMLHNAGIREKPKLRLDDLP